MRTGYLSTKLLMAGILSVAIGGCGSSDTGTNPPPGTGGEVTGTGGSGSGGIVGTGGSATGGIVGTGGAATGGIEGKGGSGSGGAKPTGGTQASGGTGAGGRNPGGATGTSTQGSGGAVGGSTSGTGGAAPGGAVGSGGRNPGGATGTAGVSGSGGKTTGGNTGSTGTCTASKSAGVNVSGTGPHKVVVESNSDSQISCGTIYRPSDLGGAEKYPIFVWGEGGCSRSGTSNQAAMGEIASHGYFVVADGPTGGGGSNCGSIGMPNSESDLPNMAKPLLGYITWAIAENGKSCSAYYDSLDTTKVAADGFSCGGLMAEATAGDSRMTTWGVSSSGLTSPYTNFYKTIHTPVKILVGGSSDQANPNGARDYTNISALGIPILFFAKTSAGHGGDLSSGTGDFNTVNLAWLNWQLKGDTGATGKGLLIGDSCKFCKASGWEFKSANIN